MSKWLLFACDVVKHCQCTATYFTDNGMITLTNKFYMYRGILLSLHFTILFIYALYTKAPPFFFHSSLHSLARSASYIVQSDSQISLIQPGLKVGWMRPERSGSLGSHLQTN